MEFLGVLMAGWVSLIIASIIVNGNRDDTDAFVWPVVLVFGWLWPLLLIIIILSTLADWRDSLGGK